VTKHRPDPADADPRWLTDDEQRTWRGLLTMHRQLMDGLDRQMRAEAGIPTAYYIILAMLSEAPKHSLRMSELAQAVDSSQSRTSHAVAALEDRGWVIRKTFPTDKRGLVAVLTDDGYAQLKHLAPKHVEHVRQLLFDHLTCDQVSELEQITVAVNEGVATD